MIDNIKEPMSDYFCATLCNTVRILNWCARFTLILIVLSMGLSFELGLSVALQYARFFVVMTSVFVVAMFVFGLIADKLMDSH
jgi:hypothetical protein